MIHHRPLMFSFKYAVEGIWYALKYNQNLRIHFLLAVVVVYASIYFAITPYEMAIVGIAILFVITAEMINTAIEQMVDLIVTEHRKEAKIAKDVAAGMVLLSALGAVGIGFFVFWPYIFEMFFS